MPKVLRHGRESQQAQIVPCHRREPSPSPLAVVFLDGVEGHRVAGSCHLSHMEVLIMIVK
jgi:hypothetical protein